VTDESANLAEYSDDDSSTDVSANPILSGGETPKYRLFPNNSLLVSSLELDDITNYKCLVRAHLQIVLG
jgi:hypothetical protein